jgi:transcriptional regulator with XRE-family HTH domain
MATSLPNYLRMVRKRSALAQHELAFLLGCAHESKVSRHERSRRFPGLSTLIAYEILFEVRWRDMLPAQYNRIHRQLVRRAGDLLATIDERLPWTPALQRKRDFVLHIINPLHSHLHE